MAVPPSKALYYLYQMAIVAACIQLAARVRNKKKKKDREQKEGKKQKQYMRVKEKREIRR
jgi:predicted pyridoxine 5'-phosphate oxidase superfamily flavin-nucleotide-binding protein